MPADEINICKSCKYTVQTEDIYCSDCGYPLQGTEEEKKQFVIKKIRKKTQLDDEVTRVRHARNALFITSALFMVSALILSLAGELHTAVLVESVIAGIIYLALGFWCKRKPFAAILTGLIIFLTIITMNIIYEPEGFYKGLIIRIIIVFFLINGLISARKVRLIRKELKNQ